MKPKKFLLKFYSIWIIVWDKVYLRWNLLCLFIKYLNYSLKNWSLNITFDYILQIHPLSGPIEGGTLVAIEGSNLGSSEDEIKDKVALGGIPCVPVDYSVSVRYVFQCNKINFQ